MKFKTQLTRKYMKRFRIIIYLTYGMTLSVDKVFDGYLPIEIIKGDKINYYGLMTKIEREEINKIIEMYGEKDILDIEKDTDRSTIIINLID